VNTLLMRHGRGVSFLASGKTRAGSPRNGADAFNGPCDPVAATRGSFRDSTTDTRFFIVLGIQGGGKTSWIRRHIGSLGSSAICLDAALPARRHRARALALAQRFSVYSIAVWINVTLERALEQNSKRAPDHVVPEFAIRSVFGLIEAPTVEEGFREIIEVTDDDGDA
jgi:hypothetical protein